MNRTDSSPLPDYDAPPVIETVLGVQFTPLEKWDIPHFGMYWHDIRGDFPSFQVQPPLESEVERFDRPIGRRSLSLQLVSRPEVRCWFIDGTERTLVQIQRNRLTYNWRKRAGEDAYPHYERATRPAFERELTRFSGFLEQHNLGCIDIIQCEVTYVNHIDIGDTWKSAADLPQLFPSWSGICSGSFLPPPDDVALNVTYRMPEKKGRLRVSVQPAIRTTDGVETLQLTLTARGKPESGDLPSALRWLDLGREWVVRGFTDFTSKKMHAIWKRKV